MIRRDEDYDRLDFKSLLVVITGTALREELPNHQHATTKPNMIAYLKKKLTEDCFIDCENTRALNDFLRHWESLDSFALMMEIASIVLPPPRRILVKRNLIGYLQNKLQETKMRDGEVLH